MSDSPAPRNIEHIWQHFSQPLFGFIKRRVNNQQDAEDILQNVFFKIYNNIQYLKDTDKIHAWVYSITRNAIIDFYRTQSLILDHTPLKQERADERKELDEPSANEEIAQCLKAMVSNLPEKYKEAIILTEFQNLTQKEMSERLGLTIPGAKSRVQRARGKLKDMLINCCQLEFDHQGHVIDYQNKKKDCRFC